MKTFSIVGLGSLMSESSAKRTCPSLSDFRIVRLRGWKRIFNKTYSRLAKSETLPKDHKRYGCLSAVPSPDEEMYVSAFTIPAEEWPAFVERECDYRLVEVPVFEEGGESKGVLCAGDYTSDAEWETVVRSDPVRLKPYERFRSLHPEEPMWRDDLLPDDGYLQRCLDAIKELDEQVFENWLDTTYLGDGITTIREYLKRK